MINSIDADLLAERRWIKENEQTNKDLQSQKYCLPRGIIFVLFLFILFLNTTYSETRRNWATIMAVFIEEN